MKHDVLTPASQWLHAIDCECTACRPADVPPRLTLGDLGSLGLAGFATGIGLGVAFIPDVHAAAAALAAIVGVGL